MAEYVQYNNYNTAEALLQFLTLVPTISAKTGEHKVIRNKPYVCTGVQMNEFEGECMYDSDIYFPVDRVKEEGTLFNKLEGREGIEYLKEFLKVLGHESEIDSIVEKYNQIVNRKALPKYFKRRAEIQRDIKVDGKITHEVGKVFTSLWSIIPETGEFCEQLIVESGSKTGKTTCVIPVTEFGKTFKINKVERSLAYRIQLDNLFDMTRWGYFKPLEIRDGDQVVYMDGRNIIYEKGDEKLVVGVIRPDGKVMEILGTKDSIRKTLVYRAAKIMMTYAANKRKFILPYGLYSTTVLSASTIIDIEKKTEAKPSKATVTSKVDMEDDDMATTMGDDDMDESLSGLTKNPNDDDDMDFSMESMMNTNDELDYGEE